MAEDKRISATRSIDASAKDIFDLLSNPARHPEIDSTGTMRSLERGDRIESNNVTFVMNMHNEQFDDYRMLNTVVGFVPNKLIAWEPGRLNDELDGRPGGWQWIWELESTGSDSTEVTLSYDWSDVTSKALLKQIHFPPWSADDLEGSLAKVAAALSAV